MFSVDAIGRWSHALRSFLLWGFGMRSLLGQHSGRLALAFPNNFRLILQAQFAAVSRSELQDKDADGKPTHNEWSGKFDGKDYPVTGDSTSDTRAYKKVDNFTNCAKLNFCTLELTAKKDGKVTMSGHIVVSPDGQSRTVTVSGTDPNGNKINTTAVYDKQ